MLCSLVCRQFGILYCFVFFFFFPSSSFFFEYNQITYKKIKYFCTFYLTLVFKLLRKKKRVEIMMIILYRAHGKKGVNVCLSCRFLLDDTCCVILKGQVQPPATPSQHPKSHPINPSEGRGKESRKIGPP
jgi:hypothetical protein